MKKNFLLLLCLLPLGLQAQRYVGSFDFRMGLGPVFLGTGDMYGFLMENELNLNIDNHLSASFSLGLGRSNYGLNESSSFFQSNINVFYLPFGFGKRNVFRLGGGLSYLRISDAVRTNPIIQNAIRLDPVYGLRNRQSPGINIIFENTFQLTDQLLVGAKLQSQRYWGDHNSSILLKIGLTI